MGKINFNFENLKKLEKSQYPGSFLDILSDKQFVDIDDYFENIYADADDYYCQSIKSNHKKLPRDVRKQKRLEDRYQLGDN